MTKQNCSFSMVIGSKNHVNMVSIGGEKDDVLVEGELGEIKKVELTEGILIQCREKSVTKPTTWIQEALVGGHD